jgi:hypothetical protein
MIQVQSVQNKYIHGSEALPQLALMMRATRSQRQRDSGVGRFVAQTSGLLWTLAKLSDRNREQVSSR